MTDVTVKLNDDTIVVLAVEANNKSITLSTYVQQLVDEHVKSVLKQQLNSIKPAKKEAKKQAKVLEIEDIDDAKQKAKKTSPKKTENKGTPLYNKKENNSWKIW